MVAQAAAEDAMNADGAEADALVTATAEAQLCTYTGAVSSSTVS